MTDKHDETLITALNPNPLGDMQEIVDLLEKKQMEAARIPDCLIPKESSQPSVMQSYYLLWRKAIAPQPETQQIHLTNALRPSIHSQTATQETSSETPAPDAD